MKQATSPELAEAHRERTRQPKRTDPDYVHRPKPQTPNMFLAIAMAWGRGDKHVDASNWRAWRPSVAA